MTWWPECRQRNEIFVFGNLTGLVLCAVGFAFAMDWVWEANRAKIEAETRAQVEKRILKDCLEEDLAKLRGLYYLCELEQTQTTYIEDMEGEP